MGANLKLLTLWDVHARDFVLEIVCPACGHGGLYDTQQVLCWFRGRRGRTRNAALEVAGSYFRCTECKHLGATLKPVPRYRAPDLRPPLIPSKHELRDKARRERG